MSVSQWMAWEGGVDLVAFTGESNGAANAMPSIILHVARMVHTPVGSAPSGMVFWQPDATAPPVLAAFLSQDARVGAYFGPHIFVGTPFETAPVLHAEIEIIAEWPSRVGAIVKVGEFVFESSFEQFGALQQINRAPEAFPFSQQGLESGAAVATLQVNGQNVPLTLPETTLNGGPAACWAPCGIYAR